jgi:hypothetical protein
VCDLCCRCASHGPRRAAAVPVADEARGGQVRQRDLHCVLPERQRQQRRLAEALWRARQPKQGQVRCLHLSSPAAPISLPPATPGCTCANSNECVCVSTGQI